MALAASEEKRIERWLEERTWGREEEEREEERRSEEKAEDKGHNM